MVGKDLAAGQLNTRWPGSSFYAHTAGTDRVESGQAQKDNIQPVFQTILGLKSHISSGKVVMLKDGNRWKQLWKVSASI